jgi:hypothetical protein
VRQPELCLDAAGTQVLDDLGVLLMDRDMVHDRRAVAEPQPQHIGVQDQVLVRHVDRVAVACPHRVVRFQS